MNKIYENHNKVSSRVLHELQISSFFQPEEINMMLKDSGNWRGIEKIENWLNIKKKVEILSFSQFSVSTELVLTCNSQNSTII